MVSVSVIIPVRNRADTLARQLEALAAQECTPPFEVVVGDHASTDGTAEVARSFSARFSAMTVVDAAGACGSPGVRNRAVAAAAGELLAFCDSDDVVHPRWLSSMIAPLEQQSCLVGGRRAFFRSGSTLPAPDRWNAEPSIGVQMRYLRFADTCSLAVRADDLRAVGGFDERFARLSDTDFSWRLQEAGVPYVLAEGAVVAKFVPAGILRRWYKHVEWGRYQPLLFRVHRNAGVPPRGLGSVVTEVASIASLAVPAVLNRRDSRRRLLIKSGQQVGRVIGALQFRTVYL